MFVGSVHTGCSTLTLKLFGFLKEELGLGCRFGVKCIETKVFQLGVRAVLNLELGALPPKRKLYLQAVHQSTSCTPFFSYNTAHPPLSEAEYSTLFLVGDDPGERLRLQSASSSSAADLQPLSEPGFHRRTAFCLRASSGAY